MMKLKNNIEQFTERAGSEENKRALNQIETSAKMYWTTEKTEKNQMLADCCYCKYKITRRKMRNVPWMVAQSAVENRMPFQQWIAVAAGLFPCQLRIQNGPFVWFLF